MFLDKFAEQTSHLQMSGWKLSREVQETLTSVIKPLQGVDKIKPFNKA